jgi:hypothetical protein
VSIRGQSASASAAVPSRWKLWLIIAIAIAFCGMFLLHVPYVNGTPYWSWHYRRLKIWPLLPGMVLAVIPFALAQFLFSRGQISARIAVWLIALSTIFIRYVAVACVADPPSLSVASQIVQHRTAFSYYHDAIRIGRDVAAGRLTWDYVIRHYPSLMPNLSMHTRIRAPGGILLSKFLIDTFGDPAAAAVMALLIALVSALAPPAAYWMMRQLNRTPEESFAAASLLALCPGFLLFFPMFDPAYVTVSAMIVVLWTKAIDSSLARAALWSFLLGILLSAALFVTYNFLVLGIFLGGLALLKIRTRPASGAAKPGGPALFSPTFIACLTLIATVAIIYLAIYTLTGFNAIATLGSALANEHRTKVVLDREKIHSQFWDLYDFSLGVAHLCIPLSLMYVFSRLPRRLKIIPLLGLAQIVIVDLVQALPFETTRVWLVLLPMLLISAGAEISRWKTAARAIVYLCMAAMTFVICQNLWFVTYDQTLLPPWARPQKLTGPHAHVSLPPPGLQ